MNGVSLVSVTHGHFFKLKVTAGLSGFLKCDSYLSPIFKLNLDFTVVLSMGIYLAYKNTD